jgi:hypothetical protein
MLSLAFGCVFLDRQELLGQSQPILQPFDLGYQQRKAT